MQSLAGIERLTELTELYASNNRIDSTEPLGNLPRLRYADLSFNELKTFDEWIMRRGPFNQYGLTDLSSFGPGPTLHIADGPLLMLAANPLVRDSTCATEGNLEVCIFILPNTNNTAPHDGGLLIRHDGDVLLEELATWGVDIVTQDLITDVTGNGRPNVVVRFWSMSGKSAMMVYEIDVETKTVDTLFADWAFGIFEDFDGDGVPELLFRLVQMDLFDLDLPIVLRFNGTAYEPVAAPLPSELELARMAYSVPPTSFRRTSAPDPFEDIPPMLKHHMGNLIVSGHWETAFRLADMAWPEAEQWWKAEALVRWFDLVDGVWSPVWGGYTPPPPEGFKAQWKADNGLPSDKVVVP